MDKQFDDTVYNESISDFASLIQEFGTRKVVSDFALSFPELVPELLRCLSAPLKKEAALFRKPECPSLP